MLLPEKLFSKNLKSDWTVLKAVVCFPKLSSFKVVSTKYLPTVRGKCLLPWYDPSKSSVNCRASFKLPAILQTMGLTERILCLRVCKHCDGARLLQICWDRSWPQGCSIATRMGHAHRLCGLLKNWTTCCRHNWLRWDTFSTKASQGETLRNDRTWKGKIVQQHGVVLAQSLGRPIDTLWQTKYKEKS